ncbi:MAG: tRNA pseudouridine(38-40) synthase TruA [Acidimicrobiales bacterium]|nr:tRNA pseudouridine(38-40) synthase TruA [Acidimicrobiales bacterium]
MDATNDPDPGRGRVATGAVSQPAQRVRLTVAYDGAAFRGFAAQRGLPTVAGALQDALARVLRHPVTLTGAGRTDAGVHAWGQVVSFDADARRLDPERLHTSLLHQLAPTIVVREVRLVDDDFDARFAARARVYRYTVLNRDVPDPFLAATTWWVPRPLDLRAMILACDPLYGEHDFSSFCRRPHPQPGHREPSMRRRVLDATWHDLGDGLLRFQIEATSFCHQMVRSITGTMVDMGLGRRRPGEMRGIVLARDRAVARSVAPPHGLCLWEVRY